MKNIFIIIKFFIALVYLSITVTIAVILFMDIDDWGEKLIKRMNYKVIDKIHGGEIMDVIDNGKYITRIHRTVFNGIFKEQKKGFIQIDWFSNELLPEYISEKIDYNKDGIMDFKIDLNTEKNKAVLTKYNDKIINIMDKTSMGDFIMKGYDDGRYGVFYYNNYKETIFLGYTINELNTFDTIKNMIVSEDIKIFNDFIDDIIKGNNVNDIEICMLDKLSKKTEKVVIKHTTIIEKGKNKHKITFITKDIKMNQQIEILASVKDINEDYKIFPKTFYKEGRSVRVMLKK